jgi:uncharacterized protein YfiM (DUF2279 family)
MKRSLTKTKGQKHTRPGLEVLLSATCHGGTEHWSSRRVVCQSHKENIRCSSSVATTALRGLDCSRSHCGCLSWPDLTNRHHSRQPCARADAFNILHPARRRATIPSGTYSDFPRIVMRKCQGQSLCSASVRSRWIARGNSS